FSEDEIRRYVEARFGGLPDPNLPAWLAQLSEVTPLSVSQALDLLEQRKIVRADGGRWALDGRTTCTDGEWTLVGADGEEVAPGGIEEVLEERLDDLEDDDHKLLQ